MAYDKVKHFKDETRPPEDKRERSPVEQVVMPYLHPGVAKIHSKRVQKIIADIDFLKNREDLVMAEDELSKAIDHLRNAIERIKA